MGFLDSLKKLFGGGTSSDAPATSQEAAAPSVEPTVTEEAPAEKVAPAAEEPKSEESIESDDTSDDVSEM